MLAQKFLKNSLIPVAAGVSMALASSAALAHGESVRGGGAGSINAVGAAILEEKVIGLRFDQRNYDTFTDQQLLNFKLQGEDVHQHTQEDAFFLSFGFPVNEDFDINLLAQYNNFKKFKDVGDAYATQCFVTRADALDDGNLNGSIQEISDIDAMSDAEKAQVYTGGNALGGMSNAAECISYTERSPGLGDTLILGRYRFYNSEEHQIASIFGIIVPTGKITNRVSKAFPGQEPEIIGTHNQPGSGAITIQGGLAYSGHITDKIAVDADLIHRVNTIGAKAFRPGNSTQFDIAVSYGHHDKWTPVIELNIIDFKKDIENYEVKKNSGGTSFYLSPGITYRVSKNQSIYANYSFVKDNLGGISNSEKNRFSLGWSYGFGG